MLSGDSIVNTKSLHLSAALIATGLLVTGCATTSMEKTTERLPVISKDGSAFYYQCNNGFGFPAQGNENSITVFLKSGPRKLSDNHVEQGFHYSSGNITLQGVGDQAYFNDGKQRYQCQIDRRKSQWEDAKYRGADFVAMGNEPGWKLELSLTGDMFYIGSYGTESFRIETPKPTHGKNGPLVFAAQNSEHSLWLSIDKKPCVDSMKGEQFDASVSLVVDDKPLTGCGMILNPLD